MKNLSLLFSILSFIIVGSIYSQSTIESKDIKDKKNTTEKTLVDSLQDLVDKFNNLKTDATNTKQDTSLSVTSKNDKLQKINITASIALDELIEKSEKIDKDKYSNFYKKLSEIINVDQKLINSAKNEENKNSIFKIIQTSSFVDILGDAGLITNALKDGTVSTKFSVGLQYTQNYYKSTKKKFYAKSLFVIFASPDTITAYRKKTIVGDSIIKGPVLNQSQFGATILNPSAGASAIQSGYYESKHYLWQNFLVGNSQGGVAMNIGFSSRIWQDSIVGQSESANILSFNVGGFIDLLDPEFNPLKLGLNAQLLYISRTLMGDVVNNVNFRESVLSGATKQFFNGVELGLKLDWKTLSAFVRMPIVINAKGIQGLSGGQFIGGINFTVPVQSFSL